MASETRYSNISVITNVLINDLWYRDIPLNTDFNQISADINNTLELFSLGNINKYSLIYCIFHQNYYYISTSEMKRNGTFDTITIPLNTFLGYFSQISNNK